MAQPHVKILAEQCKSEELRKYRARLLRLAAGVSVWDRYKKHMYKKKISRFQSSLNE
jgi:uncharacterized short protein YbdD (DUF466 family)